MDDNFLNLVIKDCLSASSPSSSGVASHAINVMRIALSQLKISFVLEGDRGTIDGIKALINRLRAVLLDPIAGGANDKGNRASTGRGKEIGVSAMLQVTYALRTCRAMLRTVNLSVIEIRGVVLELLLEISNQLTSSYPKSDKYSTYFLYSFLNYYLRSVINYFMKLQCFLWMSLFMVGCLLILLNCTGPILFQIAF
jgi:hypothetical protein